MMREKGKPGEETQAKEESKNFVFVAVEDKKITSLASFFLTRNDEDVEEFQQDIHANTHA